MGIFDSWCEYMFVCEIVKDHQKYFLISNFSLYYYRSVLLFIHLSLKLVIVKWKALAIDKLRMKRGTKRRKWILWISWRFITLLGLRGLYGVSASTDHQVHSLGLIHSCNQRDCTLYSRLDSVSAICPLNNIFNIRPV